MDTKMRVALFCPDYPPSDRQGGIQDYSRHLAQALCLHGLDVTVITGDGHEGSRADGPIDIVKLPQPWDQRWAQRAVRELENRHVDLVNLQYSPAMFENPAQLGWPIFASRFTPVVTFHTLWGGPLQNIIAALRLLHSARAVIATNSEILHLLRRYTPWYTGKTVFVPIGSNITPHNRTNIHEEVTKLYDIASSKCTLTYFGMVYPGKGLELLLGTASCLHKVHGLDFKLLCVGGGVSDVAAHQAEKHRRVSELGLGDRITWTGRIPATHVSSLLTLSDIVVLPYDSGASDRRGTMMAALAHGKPIVTTPPRVRIPHFVNGKNMIWPMSVSADSLARCIVRLYGDKDSKESLGKGAFDLASKLTWREVARDTSLLFEKIRHAATT